MSDYRYGRDGCEIGRDDTDWTQQKYRDMDARFVRAVRKAIKLGLERCRVGTKKY